METDPNDIQHGGAHYKGTAYQHWDWVNDLRLGYLVGNASKYAFRWRKKNGKEDLNKAIHYLDKAMACGGVGSSVNNKYTLFWNLSRENGLEMEDAEILWLIMEGRFAEARVLLEKLLESVVEFEKLLESVVE